MNLLTHSRDRAHLVKWLTESNRPMHLVQDREFVTLMTAGRPSLNLPSPDTVARDIRAAFTRCQQRIKTLLTVSRSACTSFSVWLTLLTVQ